MAEMAPPASLVLLIVSNVEAVIVVLEALSIVMNGECALTSLKVQSVSEREDAAPLALMMVVEKDTSAVEEELMLTDVNEVVPAVTEKRGTFSLFPCSTLKMNEISVIETVEALRRKRASPEAIASTDL